MPRPSTPRLWLLLALLSAGGMLAFGVVGMWNTTRSSQAVARAESVRAAMIEASALRDAVRSRETLERLPAGTRYTWHEGNLALPDGMSWFDRPPLAMSDEALPGVVRDRLERAEKEEFVEGRSAQARATLQATAEWLPKGAPGLDRVRLALAWNAARAGLLEERDRYLELLAEGPLPERATVIEGTLLLAAHTGSSWPTWTEEALRYLPYDRSDALLATLGAMERIEPGWRPLVEVVRRQRETLRTVARLGSLLRGSREIVVLEREDKLLVHHPEAERVGGGAWVAPSEFVAALDAGEFDRSRIALGSDPPSEAIPAIPLLSVLPRRAESSSFWSRPMNVATLLFVLAAMLFVSLYLSLRAMRQATLQMRLRTEFLASVTHELKTPLASVRLIAERLCAHRLPANKQSEYHELVRGEVDRLSLLIENLLDLGRLERGERRVETRPIAPVELVEEIVASYRPLAERDEIALFLELEPTNRQAALDREGFRQVLLNLLENARKYARHGQRIEVRGSVEGERYVIRVRDHGEGVPEEERERIFERFERGARHRESSIPGLGLGLSTARLLVRAFGGELSHERPVDGGAGAVFAIVLPLLPRGSETREPS